MTLTDSTAYTYSNTMQGLFMEFKPKFQVTINSFPFSIPTNMVNKIIHCSESRNYTGNWYPLYIADTIQNTLLAGKVIESSILGNVTNWKIFYDYNISGHMTMKIRQYFDGVNWITSDSSNFHYDNLSNLVVKERYLTTNNGPSAVIDSLFYITGSSHLYKIKNFIVDITAGIVDIAGQTEIAYLGNKIDYIDYFDVNSSGLLNWTLRYKYNYNGFTPTGFVAYTVMNNIVSSSIYFQTHFNYNSQNLFSEYASINNFDTIIKRTYDYDNDNFLVNESKYQLNQANVYYKYFETNFTYTSGSAKINEEEKVSITIYPNPTKNILKIESPEPITHIQIINMKGQIVLEQHSTEISIAHLSPGQYIVYGSTETSTFTKKIIKK